MTLSLGIKLVILLPTFLFFIGFTFKSFVDKKGMEKMNTLLNSTGNMSLVNILLENFNDFFFLLALDSIFILISNGLIIIFELEQSELGILSIIISLIFSFYVIVCIYTNNNRQYNGMYGIFFILGAEFCYFLFYDITILPDGIKVIENIFLILFGGFLGVIIGIKVIIDTMKDSVESTSSFMNDRCDKCKDNECKIKIEKKRNN